MKHNFEERKQNRIDYAKEQEQKNRDSAQRLSQSASEMASVIPMGQPILVGHHSEKGDRNYRNKIHRTFQKSREADKKAQYFGDKVASIENNSSISSDDPQALEKIEFKVGELEKLQEFMKSANKFIKKGDKDSFLKMELATEVLWDKLNQPDCFGGLGYPSYRLTNNNANIRRLKQRMEVLKKLSDQSTDRIIHEGVTVVNNVDANRVQLIFEGIPSKEVRERLSKVHNFRWCRSEGAWQRHLNNSGIYEAKRFIEWLEENQAR